MSAANLSLDCYVRGCKAPIIGGALHREFGAVHCCACHWPERGSRARVFGAGATVAPQPIDHFAVPAVPVAPVATIERPIDIPDPF